MTPGAGLRVDGLGVERGGVTVLRDLALAVGGGECVVVAGAAGTGKTSLAAALAGALPATGVVEVDGRRLSGGSPSARHRQGLAAALGDGLRLSGCSVTEALALSARQGRRPADALVLLPVLGGRAAVRVERLSGGEQQLLRVACAWVATPRALVLDAPTVGLADDVAAAVVDLARAEAGRGAAVLWLDAPGAATPAPPRLNLAGGRLVAAPGGSM